MRPSESLVEAVVNARDSAARRALLEDQPQDVRRTLVWALKDRADRLERDDARQALAVACIAGEVADLGADPASRAAAIWGQANAHASLGEYQVAAQLYERAAQYFYEADLPLEAARTRIGHIDALMYLGRYESARALAESALRVFGDHGDEVALAKIEMNLGNVHARLEEHAEALRYFRSARARFQQRGDKLYVAMTQVNEANVLTVLDDFSGAEAMYVETRRLFAAEGLRASAAMVDHDLAFLQYARGHYAAALRTFEQARAEFAALQIPMEAALIDLHESEIYLDLNLPEAALPLAQQAEDLFAAEGMNYELARARANRALALARLGSGRALALLADARSLFEVEKNEVWATHIDLARAEVLGRAGAASEALALASRAAEAYQRLGLKSKHAYAEIVRAELLIREGKRSPACDALQAASSALEELTAPWLRQRIWAAHGRIHEASGELDSAATYYQRAAEELERVVANIAADEHRAAFVADKLTPYEALVHLKAPHDAREAFHWAERAKSRAMVDALAAGVRPRLHVADAMDARRVEELQSIRDELHWHYTRLTRGGELGEAGPPAASPDVHAKIIERERRAMGLWRALQARHAGLASLQRVTATPAEEIQAALRPSEALVEYFVARDQILAFVVRRHRIRVFPLASLAALRPLWSGLSFQLSKFQYGAAYFQRHRAQLVAGTAALLAKLHERLLSPLGPDAADAESLIVVPHGPLHHLPFHALHRDGRYLIQSQAVSYAPSASVFKLCRDKAAPAGAAAYSRPLFVGVSDERAARAGEEALRLARLFPEATTLIDGEATTAKLRELAPGRGLLHLAAHALFRPEAPLLSAVRLSDAWLAAQDVFDFDLQASLVTLNACESGLGRIAGGDDFIGLVRGFLYAGAASLLVSLWMVDDESAARLMSLFYNLLSQGETKAQALRRAQMALLEEEAHPYFWAPMVLIGSPQ